MPAGLSNPIRSQTVTLTADGSGDATDTMEVNGEIICLKIDLLSGMLTADVTVTSDVGLTVLNDVTVAADTTFTPWYKGTENDGSTATSLHSNQYICGGTLTVTIASATATKSLSVTAYYR